jgi:phage gpG-like protein
VSADFSQLHDFIKKFPAVADKMGREAAIASAMVLQKQMKEVMGSEGGGRVGTTRSGRNKYLAAPAGAFPAIRSGNLRRSIQFNVNSDGSVDVGSNLDYAKALEYGTSRMIARPWLWRSYNLAKSAMSDAAKRAIIKVFKDNIK